MKEVHSKEYDKEVLTWLSDFLDEFPMAICRISFFGSIVYCNHKFSEIFGGASKKKLMGTQVEDLLGDKSVMDALLCSFLDSDVVYNLPICMKSPSEENVWCWIHSRRVCNENGKPAFFDTCLERVDPDFHDRRQKIASENSPLKMEIHLDLKGNILNVDINALKILGYSEAELIGRSLQEFIVPENVDDFLWLLYETMEKGSLERKIMLMRKSGDPQPMSLGADLVRSKGKPDRIRAVGMDVREAVRKEKLNRHTERFQGVLEMAGAVSLAIQDPLAGMNQILRQWRQGVGSEDPIQEKLEILERQMKRINRIYSYVKNVRKYRSMEYVSGVQVLDIEESAS